MIVQFRQLPMHHQLAGESVRTHVGRQQWMINGAGSEVGTEEEIQELIDQPQSPEEEEIAFVTDDEEDSEDDDEEQNLRRTPQYSSCIHRISHSQI